MIKPCQSTITILFAALSIVASSCSKTNDTGIQEVATPAEPTSTTLEGLGVQLDPHFLSQNVTRNDGAAAADWDNIVVRRVEMMKIQRFRVMVLPHWWEPVNDNDDPSVANMAGFTFDNIEMKSLYAVLDLAQKTGADVTLVLWGCPTNCTFIDTSTPSQGQRHFLCDASGTGWMTAPGNNEEFAENFSVLVKYLIEKKGYTCVKEITPFNEPDGFVDRGQYMEVVKAMDARFTKDGIRDKIRFNLSDNTDSRRYFLADCAAEVPDIADIFNSHTYIFGYEMPNSDALDWEKQNIKAISGSLRKHYVEEFGSNLCVGAARQKDINWYKRGVLIARNCLNFLNAGAAGASYWSLIDQYYNKNDSYGSMQQLGLWRYKKNVYQAGDDEGCDSDYQPRPQYYAYSLLTRFIRKGDRVYPLDLGTDFAAGTAFKSEDGKWTYVFANGSWAIVRFNLANANDNGLDECKVYRYTEKGLPQDDSMIASSETIKASGKDFKIEIPGQSILLLTQK